MSVSQTNGLLILLSFSILVMSFWNRDRLRDDMAVESYLTAEPVQVETEREEQTASVGDYDYEITPLYDYEITGLVVSYRLHSGKHGVHRLTKDNLNVADLCIVWGANATDLPLTEFKFWNREFTCYVQTKSSAHWESFNGHELSNNHLITNDPDVRDAIRDVRIGDQVTIRGWLAEYRNVQTGGLRGSSTVRTDTGNGACETILVDDITIVSSYTSNWRVMMYLSLLVFLASLGWYLIKPVRVTE